MFKLMENELKKLVIWKYFVGLIPFILLLVFILTLEMSDFTSHQDILGGSSTFIRLIFTIFTGVLIANIIIREFETGTMINMFLYPISKKKIMVSKILLVVSISLILMILVQIFLAGVIIYVNNNLKPTFPNIDSSIVIPFFFASVASFIASTAATMISLFVGLKTNSSVATIVWAVVMSLLLNGQLGTSRLTDSLVIMVLLTFLGSVIVLFSIRSVYRQNN